jgi:adenine-specific DNA-methyltransferase
MPSWWSAQAAAAGLSEEWLDVRWAVEAASPLEAGAEEAFDHSWAGLSAEEVGATYVSSLSRATRMRHGRHYTPAPLAERLWEMARSALGHARQPTALPGLVRDPACGSGALLLPVLREHLAGSRTVDPREVMAGLPNLIEGLDADPAAVWIANVVLAAQALSLVSRIPARHRRPLPTLVRVGDGLSVSERPARLVLMNPPYGRVRLTEEERSRFAAVLYGHANLYGLFVAVGLGSLDDHGVVAALVPTSFTSGRYFARLRAEIARTATLEEITFVTARDGVFSSVLQETCLAVLTKRPAARTAISNIDEAGVHAVAAVTARYCGDAWVLPRRADDAAIAAAATVMPLRLATAGWSASTGPLVWNRRKDDLHAGAAVGRHYVIWAADIDGGSLHRDPARDAMRYVTLHGAKDRTLNLLASGAVLVQRTTAPEQRRRVVAVELSDGDVERLGGVVVENHVNVLRPNIERPPVSRATLARLLATRTFDRLMRCISGSVAISAYELESLPLPDAGTLESWEALTGESLEASVALAYGGLQTNVCSSAGSPG